MVTGVAVFDLLLGEVDSLKQKRAVVRPIVAALKRLDVAAAETGALALHRRAEIAVASVANSHGRIRDVLDACERLVAGRPEVQLLACKVRIFDDDDVE